jgi:hypothetical protein
VTKTVWRYTMQASPRLQQLHMPKDAKITYAVTEVDGWVSFWAWHDSDTSDDREVRIMAVTGTGEETRTENAELVISFLSKQGMMLHMWDLTEDILRPPVAPEEGPFVTEETDGG